MVATEPLPSGLDETLENLRLELRRGAVVIAVLGHLRTEHYGYALRRALGDQGLEIEENTLYPLLRRLETQGLLESEWREVDRRSKRFYRLSSDGESVLVRLLEHWDDLDVALKRIIKEDRP